MSDFPWLWKKTIFLKKNCYFCDKSPLEDVKVRHFKWKIALGVQYTPCDHEGLISTDFTFTVMERDDLDR